MPAISTSAILLRRILPSHKFLVERYIPEFQTFTTNMNCKYVWVWESANL